MSALMEMTRRQLKKDETRTLILAAARTLLERQGIEAMNTRAVAQQAGVGVGTVFLHFADKAALIEAMLHDHVELALAHALETIPSGDLATELVHVASCLYSAYESTPALSRIYLREALFFTGGTGRPLAEQLRLFREWASERFAAAVERGEIAPIDPQLAFAAFFSFYLGLLVSGLRGEMVQSARVAMLEALVRRHFRLEEKR